MKEGIVVRRWRRRWQWCWRRDGGGGDVIGKEELDWVVGGGADEEENKR